LIKYRGDTPVYLFIEKQNKTVVADRSLWIKMDNIVINELKALLGNSNVKIC
jgi:DNA polymerase-3 subunit alpha